LLTQIGTKLMRAFALQCVDLKQVEV